MRPNMLHAIKLLCEETREGHLGSCRDGQISRGDRHVEVEVEAASMCRTPIGMGGGTKKTSNVSQAQITPGSPGPQ